MTALGKRGKVIPVQTDVIWCDQVKNLVDSAMEALWAHRRHDQQCRTDAAVANRASEDRGLGPDDRR